MKSFFCFGVAVTDVFKSILHTKINFAGRKNDEKRERKTKIKVKSKYCLTASYRQLKST
jgi:hypothetical protein